MTWDPNAGAGLPNLPDGTEVSTGRKLRGKDTYLKLVRGTGTNYTGNNNIAHGITNLDEVFSLYGIIQRDNGQQNPLPFVSPNTSFLIALNMDSTNFIMNMGSGWIGSVGQIMSYPVFIVEYSKT